MATQLNIPDLNLAGSSGNVLNTPITAPSGTGANNLDPVSFIASLDPTASVSDTVKKLLSYQKQFEAAKKSKSDGSNPDSPNDNVVSAMANSAEGLQSWEKDASEQMGGMVDEVMNGIGSSIMAMFI